jgi:hypothetical protein
VLVIHELGNIGNDTKPLCFIESSHHLLRPLEYCWIVHQTLNVMNA